MFDRLGVPYEDLDPVAAARRYPFVDFRRFGPPATLHDDDHPFWGEPTATHDGVVVMPEAGYITDPQLAALNLTAAALDAGAQFHFRTTVIAVERTAQQVTGVRLDDGTRVSSPVIVNAAGPHSRRINQMAGVLEQMPLSSRPLRREVYLVAAPRGVEARGARGDA